MEFDNGRIILSPVKSYFIHVVELDLRIDRIITCPTPRARSSPSRSPSDPHTLPRTLNLE